MHYTWLVNFNLGPLLAFFYYYLCVRVYHPNDLKHRVSIFYPHFAAVQFALQQNWLKLRVSCPSRVLTAYFYAILSCTCRYKYPSWSSIRLRIKDICRLSRNWSLWNNCSGAQYYNLFERGPTAVLSLYLLRSPAIRPFFCWGEGEGSLIAGHCYIYSFDYNEWCY